MRFFNNKGNRSFLIEGTRQVREHLLGAFVLLEIEEVREKIKQLDESYAKSLLMIIYSRLDTAINGTGGNEVIKQTVKDLFDLYSKLPDSKKFKKK